jgi:F-type H+-transporting ATPase subunit epsilon
MTEHLLKLTISRVSEPVFNGEVVSVTLPGASGEMTLLANHSALISPLVSGTITFTTQDQNKTQLTIDGGVLEVSANHATILI